MEKRKKKFDAVKMMRAARDRISRDIQGMSHEEQEAYFKEHAEQVRSKLQVAEKSDGV